MGEEIDWQKKWLAFEVAGAERSERTLRAALLGRPVDRTVRRSFATTAILV